MSSTMSDRDDPARLERNGEAIRADMNATLDALGRKLSPGQLIDRSAEFLRDHGGEVASNLGRQVRENPLPLAITAIGLTWLIVSSARSSGSQRRLEYGTDDFAPDDYATAYAESDGEAAEPSGRFAEAKSRVREKAAEIRDRVQQRTEGARDRLQESTDRLRSSAAVRGTQEQFTRARDGFATMAEEQPLALGAIGLAIGALVGAMLPGTRQEDELLGSTRDRAVARARELGTEQYAQLRERAVRAAERAQEAAKEAFRGNGNAEESRIVAGAPRDEGAFRGASTPVGRA